MPDGEISIMEALNQIQSWLNAGDLDKVIQGCQEILEIEPGNTRALSMLKQAETLRHEREMAKETEAPVSPEEPAIDPIQNLQVEKTPEPVASTPAPEPEPKPELPKEEMDDYSVYHPPRPSKRKMFLAMVIPAALVVLVGGLIITAMNNANRDSILGSDEDVFVEEHDHSDRPETDLGYLEENEQRVTDLTEMANAIDEFWYDNGHYPSISEVEDLIEDELGYIPVDPRQDELDASGDPFGYTYAIYNITSDGAETYILSALFQDSKGEAHPWAQGASTKHYDDYRKVKNINVTYIGD